METANHQKHNILKTKQQRLSFANYVGKKNPFFIVLTDFLVTANISSGKLQNEKSLILETLQDPNS